MKKQVTINKAICPNEWLKNLVIKENINGSLCICLDQKYLNKVIKQEHYPIPTLEQLTQNHVALQTFYLN